MDCDSRTIGEVDIVAEKAKLQLTDLLPCAQTLYFSPSCNTNAVQLKLLEADAHILEHISGGNSVVIRGEPDDAAVLCTSERTYELREAETSNSLLLLKQLDWPEQLDPDQQRHAAVRQVSGVFYNYLETRQCGGRLRRLETLLSAEEYRGRHQPGRGYFLQQLLETVQCSRAELIQALKNHPAVLIDGQYHALDFEYEFHVFSLILGFVDENSWSLDAIRRDVTVATLSEIEPRPILEHCFDRYCVPTAADGSDGGGKERLYRLHEERVCRLFAELLLRPVKSFNLAEFTTVWQQSVPEGLSTGLSQLAGLAVVCKENSPQVVRLLRPSDLPEDTQQRFHTLFSVKPFWTGDEIQPYLQDLTTPSLKMASLLAKNTRVSTRNGIKVYGPKHG